MKEAWAILTKYSCVPVRSYSTNIKDAWEVVENFYSMTFDRWSNGKEFRCYLVIGRDGKNFDGMAVAETASLAICRAALLAVMEDKK